MNIYVNQLGYMAKGRKRAVLALDAQAFSAEKDITVFIIGQNREHCVFRKNAVLRELTRRLLMLYGRWILQSLR